MIRIPLTPSQTVGPFLHIALAWDDGAHVVPEDAPGALWLRGQVYDGAGMPVPDALVETWQADVHGRFDHPDDPRGAAPAPPGFRGFGRCATGPDGEWAIRTVKPGAVPTTTAQSQAPHVDVSIFARGLLDRVVTRVYFSDEADANDVDPVLGTVPAHRRGTLVAQRSDDGYHFDIRLQGDGETVFFDL
jgi:protocatechuate 3,4-dioxygenase alpha subunit